jgi:hypothetical protein
MWSKPNRRTHLGLAFVLFLVCCVSARAEVPEPISLWRFQADATDSGAAGNNGTLQGTASIVADPERGNCLQADGDGYVDVPSGVAELGNADFTIAAWVKTTKIGVPILSKSNGNTQWETREKELYIANSAISEHKNNGTIEYVGHGCNWIRGAARVDDGQWHYIAITWDLDEKDGHVYVDGAEGTDRAGFSGGADNAGDTVRIGFSESAHSSSNFTGRIDDVAIFDTALTAEQVVELMRLGSGPVTRATNPDPENGATEVPLQVVLTWRPGDLATKHDVYFGTNPEDVAGATAEPSSVYKGRQDANRYPTEGQLKLDYARTYYWRIDEHNRDGTVTKGPVWSFSTDAMPTSDPHIVGWWKLNDVSGKTAADFSKHARKGTLKGGLSFDRDSVRGRVGKALRFDGKDDYIEIAGFKGVTGTRPRTVSAWIKTTTPRGEIISWGTDEYGQMWIFGFIRGRVGVTPNGGYLYMNAPVDDGRWHHVAAVVHEAQLPNLHDHVKLYKDGNIAEIHDIGLLDLWPIETGADLDVRIGKGFNGLIDDVRIYDRAISEDEIQALY